MKKNTEELINDILKSIKQYESKFNKEDLLKILDFIKALIEISYLKENTKYRTEIQFLGEFPFLQIH